MVETKKIQRRVLEPLQSRGEARETMGRSEESVQLSGGVFSLIMKISVRVQFT